MTLITTRRTPSPDKSRKEQVLYRLRDSINEWVDGTELATAQVGGSEGLRRVRELINAGFAIEKRRHPDPKRNIWQYRLTAAEPVANPEPKLPLNVPSEYDWKRQWKCETCGGPPVERPQPLMGPFGNAKCTVCGGRRVFKQVV